MNAFVYKDLMVLKSISKSYILLLTMFAALSLTGVYDATMFAGVCVMILILLPITTAAYDEQAGWDKFAAVTPSGRGGVVRGKYLFVLLMAGAGALFVTVFYAAGSLVMPEKISLAEGLVSGVACIVVGLLISSLFLPLILKYGTQKSRILLMVVAVAMSFVAFGVVALIKKCGLDIERAAIPAAIMLPILTAAAMCVSYKVSCRIFKNKEL
ncbi:MAG: ABC-2 transporter permease [Oscillospiraceae bacterium]